MTNLHLGSLGRPPRWCCGLEETIWRLPLLKKNVLVVCRYMPGLFWEKQAVQLQLVPEIRACRLVERVYLRISEWLHHLLSHFCLCGKFCSQREKFHYHNYIKSVSQDSVIHITSRDRLAITEWTKLILFAILLEFQTPIEMCLWSKAIVSLSLARRVGRPPSQIVWAVWADCFQVRVLCCGIPCFLRNPVFCY